MAKRSGTVPAGAIPYAAQNQSRLLPSWLPLHRCTVDGCDQSGAFDRRDGRCYYHGKLRAKLLGPYVDDEVGRPDLGMYRNSQGRINHGRAA